VRDSEYQEEVEEDVIRDGREIGDAGEVVTG
jgi:hypothetical protein